MLAHWTYKELRSVFKGVGLYFHVPFCKRKCWYCDFYTEPLSEADVDDYVRLLKTEAERRVGESPVVTVYFGGGSPSAIWDGALAELCSVFAERHAPCEITVEVNPEDLSEGLLRSFELCGVSRVSLGVQSFGRRGRRALGRGEVLSALRLYDKWRERFVWNVDLIYGWQGQTVGDWIDDIGTVLRLGFHHLSAYELKVPSGAESRAADENTVVELYWEGATFLDEFAVHYEVSNYSLNGIPCYHNLLYWLNLPVMGVGAGAWGYDGFLRYRNCKLSRYRRRVEEFGVGTLTAEMVSTEERRRETLMLALRTSLLWNPEGLAISEEQWLKRSLKEGLLEYFGGGLYRTTEKGFLLNNYLLSGFFARRE